MLTVVASEFRMYVLGSEARDERPSFSVKKKAPKINGKLTSRDECVLKTWVCDNLDFVFFRSPG